MRWVFPLTKLVTFLISDQRIFLWLPSGFFFLSLEICYLSGVLSVSVFIGLNVTHISNNLYITDRQMLISKSHLTLFGI